MILFPLILHERRSDWKRRLRPWLTDPDLAWRESRSIGDLVNALAGSIRPLVLVDLRDSDHEALGLLPRIAAIAPDATTLLMLPPESLRWRWLARELGVTHVLDAMTPPPEVAGLLGRWLRVARSRASVDGRDVSPYNPIADDSIVPSA